MVSMSPVKVIFCIMIRTYQQSGYLQTRDNVYQLGRTNYLSTEGFGACARRLVAKERTVWHPAAKPKIKLHNRKRLSLLCMLMKPEMTKAAQAALVSAQTQ